MMEWVIIYIIGVLLFVVIFVWLIKETDKDVTLFELIRMGFIALMSWISIVLFIVISCSMWIEGYCSKIIIKKGKIEREEQKQC